MASLATSLEVLPLLKAPSSWPLPLTASVAMVALAGLDLLGAFAAKEWVEHRSTPMLVVGFGAFAVLFYVYASALQYAELALVTMGWIVVLQVGLLALDRLRYGVELPAGKWVAVTVILVAQGYLLMPTKGTADVGAPAPLSSSARSGGATTGPGPAAPAG